MKAGMKASNRLAPLEPTNQPRKMEVEEIVQANKLSKAQ